MRKPRIAYPGALYHVICRGNNRQEIFLDDCDKTKYLETLKECRELFKLKLFAYALMSNHVHLLIQTPEANISKAMKCLNWTYCIYFNGRHCSAGHLFENRFKAKLVQKERYLLSLIKYIQLNPAKAGLCSDIDSYAWTSHASMLKRDSSLIEVSEVLNFFNNADSINAYKEFMTVAMKAGELELFGKQRSGVIGDTGFRKRIRLEKVA